MENAVGRIEAPVVVEVTGHTGHVQPNTINYDENIFLFEYQKVLLQRTTGEDCSFNP